VVPAPFGFGLWTGHFTPTILGAPCAIMDHFSPRKMIEIIERDPTGAAALQGEALR